MFDLLSLASLSHHEITMMLVALALLLATARVMGEVAQRCHQPSIVGEIFAGILLGPTFFGAMAPEISHALFPREGPGMIVLDGFTNLAIVLFLLVAGMEVDLSTVWKQGGTALKIGITGMVVPFAVGFLVAWQLPATLGQQEGANPLVFSLFFATAVSISALPIVVKILMDLNLYRSDFGMVVVASCVLNDLIGWMVFSTILGMGGGPSDLSISPIATIFLAFTFTVLVLTAGRWAFHRILPLLQLYAHYPSGVLAFAMTAALLGAAFTEWIGVHAILGSFLVGVAIGDSSHLREQTRTVIDQFISFIFAPLFFASIGLRVNFIESFDMMIVVTVIITAVVGKLGGCTLGALWGRMPRREAQAVGFAMVSVGAMGIIVGLLALEYGIIRQRLFVALVLMALLTSMISGPMVQFSLGRRKQRTAVDLITSRTFVPDLKATTRRQAIQELVEVACANTVLASEEVVSAVWAREETMHTGIGNGVAIPHARLENLSSPIVCLGISQQGVDFDAPDGLPANILFLVLTPVDDNGEQLEIMAGLTRAFRDPATVEKVQRSGKLTEILAMLKSHATNAK